MGRVRWGSVPFSERLAFLIEAAGYESEAQFAERAGIPKATVNRYTNGKSEPSLSNLLLLKAALRCSWVHLLGE